VIEEAPCDDGEARYFEKGDRATGPRARQEAKDGEGDDRAAHVAAGAIEEAPCDEGEAAVAAGAGREGERHKAARRSEGDGRTARDPAAAAGRGEGDAGDGSDMEDLF
jgi:hypothetical protein